MAGTNHKYRKTHNKALNVLWPHATDTERTRYEPGIFFAEIFIERLMRVRENIKHEHASR